MAGRVGVPLAIHDLKGNPSKLNMKEEKAKQANYPPLAPDAQPPEYFTAEEKQYWLELAQRFNAIKVLTTMDTMALELLITAYGEWRRHRDFLSVRGYSYETSTSMGDTKYNKFPEAELMINAWERIFKMLQQFGWTPASRSKVSPISDHKADLVQMFTQSGARGK
ncbi:putative terminase small subunit [Serratia phage vB_SmaS_Opt-169]|nr:putative terminase small subunit [Serratia phage vB_SmaS_Opt-169]UGO51942.1 putative terminase small subunit [Serratia phage vB_SmaS_PhooPhighters]